MRVFLTGGSGYLGRATIAALTRHGHQVSALVRSDAAADAVVHLGQFRDGDIPGIDRDGVAGRPRRPRPVHTGGLWVYGYTDGVADEDSPQRPPRITAWRRANEEAVLARGGRLVMPGVVNAGDAEPADGRRRRSLRAGPAGHRGPARRELGWAPSHTDALTDLRTP